MNTKNKKNKINWYRITSYMLFFMTGSYFHSLEYDSFWFKLIQTTAIVLIAFVVSLCLEFINKKLGVLD